MQSRKAVPAADAWLQGRAFGPGSVTGRSLLTIIGRLGDIIARRRPQRSAIPAQNSRSWTSFSDTRQQRGEGAMGLERCASEHYCEGAGCQQSRRSTTVDPDRVVGCWGVVCFGFSALSLQQVHVRDFHSNHRKSPLTSLASMNSTAAIQRLPACPHVANHSILLRSTCGSFAKRAASPAADGRRFQGTSLCHGLPSRTRALVILRFASFHRPLDMDLCSNPSNAGRSLSCPLFPRGSVCFQTNHRISGNRLAQDMRIRLSIA